MTEDVRCLVLVESDGGYEATDVRGRPHALPEGVTPRHVAAMLALLDRGNATPLLACVPPRSLPRVEHQPAGNFDDAS